MKCSISKTRPGDSFPDQRPLLYFITNRRELGRQSLIRCMRNALDLGVNFIQIREKDLPERALYDLTVQAVSMARATGCRILVNGRADIALAAGADGVHLPSQGLQIADIRSWIPKGFMVGVSVHTTHEIRSACVSKADYILVGHVLPTPSKERLGPSLGLEFLREACACTSIPMFALGGMTAEAIGPVLKTGAAGIAGISLFQKPAEFARLKKILPKIREKVRRGVSACQEI